MQMNPKIYEFDAVLQKVDGIDGAYIEFPWDVKEEFQKGISAPQSIPSILELVSVLAVSRMKGI